MHKILTVFDSYVNLLQKLKENFEKCFLINLELLFYLLNSEFSVNNTELHKIY